jgi:protein disulfide-isomerase A6
LCKNREIPLNGVITVYSTNKRQVFKFEGQMIAYEIVEFVEGKTLLKSIIPKYQPTNINHLNFDEFIRNHKCSIIFYIYSQSQLSKIIHFDMNELAHAFSHEPNVGIGSSDCYAYYSFCSSRNITSAPLIISYPNENVMQGKRCFNNFLNFTNSECNTFRISNGSLNKFAGTNPYLEQYVENFMKKDFKKQIISKIKKFPRGILYGHFMKKILVGGSDLEINKMISIYQKVISSNNTLDGIRDDSQIYLNILKVFEKHRPFIPEHKNHEL